MSTISTPSTTETPAGTDPPPQPYDGTSPSRRTRVRRPCGTAENGYMSPSRR